MTCCCLASLPLLGKVRSSRNASAVSKFHTLVDRAGDKMKGRRYHFSSSSKVRRCAENSTVRTTHNFYSLDSSLYSSFNMRESGASMTRKLRGQWQRNLTMCCVVCSVWCAGCSWGWYHTSPGCGVYRLHGRPHTPHPLGPTKMCTLNASRNLFAGLDSIWQ